MPAQNRFEGFLTNEQALTYSAGRTDRREEHLRSIYVSTYGILFLGTPHNWYHDRTKLANILQKIADSSSKEPFLRQIYPSDGLDTASEAIININKEFTAIQRRFRLSFFHEELKTNLGRVSEYVSSIRAVLQATADQSYRLLITIRRVPLSVMLDIMASKQHILVCASSTMRSPLASKKSRQQYGGAATKHQRSSLGDGRRRCRCD